MPATGSKHVSLASADTQCPTVLCSACSCPAAYSLRCTSARSQPGRPHSLCMGRALAGRWPMHQYQAHSPRRSLHSLCITCSHVYSLLLQGPLPVAGHCSSVSFMALPSTAYASSACISKACYLTAAVAGWPTYSAMSSQLRPPLLSPGVNACMSIAWLRQGPIQDRLGCVQMQRCSCGAADAASLQEGLRAEQALIDRHFEVSHGPTDMHATHAIYAR